jgi:uncharacterized membrane protein YgcG
MIRRLPAQSILFAALACAPAGVLAQDFPEELITERILDFRSEIAVHADGSMVVRETIQVKAAGEQIRRGIYRDFPTQYRDRLGNYYTVGFEVLEALRDGQPESFRVESEGNGKRVYLGRKGVNLDPGEYTYAITYRTTRQLGFFADHDELYWNATGNGWAFPINRATAIVTLPTGIQRSAILLEGYTGPEGSLGKAFEASVDAQSRPVFVTTKPLNPSEGLTIVVSWPKGFIAPPTREMKIQWFLEDNLSTLVGLAGLLILFGYYFMAWLWVGRDPAKGVIMPLYQPPEGFSPAAVRYVTEMGFDHRTFAAAILNMAVKRYLSIQENDGVFTLIRTKGGTAQLSPEEKAVADKLFAADDRLELRNTHHARISQGIEALKTWLRLNLEKHYFLTNRRYLIPGLIGSALLLVVVALSAPGEQKIIAGFMTLWLTGWSVGVFFLLSQVIQAWRGVRTSGTGQKIFSAGGAMFLTLFSLPFIAGEIFGIVMLAVATSAAVIVILLLVAATNYLFHYLLKAPTRTGRALLDQIEGFKMFLAATEQDRMNILYPPMRTPELFEKYLPYALALGVEQEWSEQFAEILAYAAQRGTTYSPAWYSGTAWRTLGASGFASSLGSSFSSAISSSSSPPGSRSGRSGSGGGGSSGGGGGGGGGGGW